MSSTPGPACRSKSGGPWRRRRFPIRRHAQICVDSRSDSKYFSNAMRSYLPARLFRQSPLLSALLALLLPICLVGGGSTAGIAAAGSCQPQALTPDFCTKVTHQSDVAAVVPEAVISIDGASLRPQILSTPDTFKHLLPGYLTTPSGRSPPPF